jgi:hypothetical protein
MMKQFVALVAVTLACTTVLAQTPGSVAPRVRITYDARRVSGRLMAVDSDALTLVPDGGRDSVRVPLSSVSDAEVSEGKRSRVAADVAGIGVGFGAGFGTILVGLASCGGLFGCSTSAGNASVIVGVASGIASGIAVAHRIGRERWRTVPVASLATPIPTPAVSRPATRR